MMSLRLSFSMAASAAALFALLLFGGCSSSVMIGSDDGGVDAGSDIDAGNGEACGANTCRDGEFCCNASCGICAPLGGTCIEIACTDPVVCNGQVCEGEGATCCPGCFLGESHCSGPSGGCPPVACPGNCTTDADCAGGRCCDDCDPAPGGFCVGPMDPCPDLSCPPPSCGDEICGADQQCCPGGCPGIEDYCAPADSMCLTPDCPAPTCDPFDAYGVGECRALLGVKWNGSYCETIGGCDCVGADCSRLYATEAECRGYHEGSCGGQPGCSSDLDCPTSHWCHGCARGSCPVCEDCVADCAPITCMTEGEPTCDEGRPECGEQGTAVVRDGCWVCVDAFSCEVIDRSDCRAAGCPPGESCESCFSGWTCLPEGAVCAL